MSKRKVVAPEMAEPKPTAWLAVGWNPPEHTGALLLDIRPSEGVVTGDIRALDFPGETFAGVELHHVLEHLERDEAPGALAELWRVLAPGGALEISVPDLVRCARTLLSGAVQIIINIYSPDGEPAMRHRWGYTPATLRAALEAAAFVDIREVVDHRDTNSVRMHCRKPGGAA
jgi:SAM-dependent methyltransferase